MENSIPSHFKDILFWPIVIWPTIVAKKVGECSLYSGKTYAQIKKKCCKEP